MINKFALKVAIISALLATSAFAQGEFLRTGESGFGLSGGPSFGNGTQQIGLTIGFCAKGRSDIALSYAEDTDRDVKAYGLRYTHYLKFENKSGSNLFGLAFGLGYVRTEAKLRYWFASSVETNHAFFGVAIFNNLRPGDIVLLHFYIASSNYYDLDGGVDPFTSSLSVGTDLVFANEKTFRPHIGFSVTIPDDGADESYLGLNAGFVTAW